MEAAPAMNSPWVRRALGQPGWVLKTSLTVATLVVVIPLAVLLLLAALIGFATFIVLSAVAAVLPSRDGHPIREPLDTSTPERRNVRVIDPASSR